MQDGEDAEIKQYRPKVIVLKPRKEQIGVKVFVFRYQTLFS